MENRPQWGTRAGFVLAAIGSAVGLGNIWRFPAVAYENGGGAFFLPYLFALLTAGIPLLILEFTLGHKYKGSSPLSFARLNKKYEWLGWWQVAISFVISTYYPIIIAWALSYAVFSFNLSWGDKPGDFLMGDFLKVAESPGDVGGIVPGVFIALLIVWALTFGIMFRGVKKGIEIANKFMLPTLVIMFLVIVIRAVTLDGALDGLNAFFKPNWSDIANPKVWVAAYGQIFFSLSVGFAIMLTYASYLPKKTDITNNAFITGFANSGFELLAGIGVFAALGFMANQQGVAIDKVVESGIGLAFVVFPQIINEFPAFNGFFGFLFFGCLFMAGLTSSISIIETYVAGLQDKFKVSRTKAVAIGGGLSALISILYATNGGLYFLDSVDAFINTFGIVIAGLVEVVLVVWVAKKLGELQNHANAISDLRIGGWWKISLGFITPIVLGYMTVQNFITNIQENYEGYPTSFLLVAGWGVALLALVAGIFLSFLRWEKNTLNSESEREVS
ncbi:transporter [Bacillus sp. FJAT-18017]|uniref:sodium-dependent transporter n=1 Tax=Bacillus sp. FJAT-18017 TaxID=1705566 RepID=UPI0006AF6C5A|nr:sodium-dependent transporter [Bacillus sp. FJAT-18017]ALC89475.1 transporter [Bacillus sp. FJAT-18017]